MAEDSGTLMSSSQIAEVLLGKHTRSSARRDVKEEVRKLKKGQMRFQDDILLKGQGEEGKIPVKKGQVRSGG